MQRLKIPTTSIFLFLILWIFTGCSLLFFIVKIEPLFIRLLLAVCAVIVSRYLTKKLVEGVLEVTIDNSEINFRWIKKPPLNLLNLTKISLDDITNFKLNSNAHYAVLKIYSSSWTRRIEGESIYDNKNEDFKKFEKRLKQIKIL